MKNYEDKIDKYIRDSIFPETKQNLKLRIKYYDFILDYLNKNNIDFNFTNPITNDLDNPYISIIIDNNTNLSFKNKLINYHKYDFFGEYLRLKIYSLSEKFFIQPLLTINEKSKTFNELYLPYDDNIRIHPLFLIKKILTYNDIYYLDNIISCISAHANYLNITVPVSKNREDWINFIDANILFG